MASQGCKSNPKPVSFLRVCRISESTSRILLDLAHTKSWHGKPNDFIGANSVCMGSPRTSWYNGDASFGAYVREEKRVNEKSVACLIMTFSGCTECRTKSLFPSHCNTLLYAEVSNLYSFALYIRAVVRKRVLLWLCALLQWSR